ncbi:hypothetical protein A3H65_00965 [Candidatus Giovannonibacteria bacterium RIFCSPLOWO2_02_FULL_45_14]|uniref:TRASH domain-containing protein n=1 Tax=Candidatus Giovannonibacteria bacterium RIFCSPLOWO2_12_FULL_44_15 TaxID=1798364 RepID=A0A1F5Y000_9BACT|nr:MAG: hypothetical protein A3C75_01390 [Candidatus Giovannonibacteria bacterium RIFCSPHIGHO2_02_FULL_44_31]OGF76016.1 MAG: hypothetical protein A3E62_01800 [Candidatus Giovannonibacteria bacterium RIFCSPHIGHO2_12_FULL_44_29]OGF90912.1 MAG: hypothetical protein A3H65_00965 [Candidatus Giovannonibacteria bacterium RIFCSPLOWO2_02_FULL_45_14]OGF93432.1 MAG: hypothetical protein A3G54_04035 [Candidatus Giovannonibacteria bacterium RIFCSPLOWO2_12_FULL_44_15]
MIDKEKILDTPDPVCGLKINPQKAKFSSKIGEQSYYFCSGECKKKFDLDPHKYSNSNEYPLDE